MLQGGSFNWTPPKFSKYKTPKPQNPKTPWSKFEIIILLRNLSQNVVNSCSFFFHLWNVWYVRLFVSSLLHLEEPSELKPATFTDITATMIYVGKNQRLILSEQLVVSVLGYRPEVGGLVACNINISAL